MGPIQRLIARMRYGSPLAVDPAWLRAHKAEQAARRAHAPTRAHQLAKQEALHRALAGGR